MKLGEAMYEAAAGSRRSRARECAEAQSDEDVVDADFEEVDDDDDKKKSA